MRFRIASEYRLSYAKVLLLYFSIVIYLYFPKPEALHYVKKILFLPPDRRNNLRFNQSTIQTISYSDNTQITKFTIKTLRK